MPTSADVYIRSDFDQALLIANRRKLEADTARLWYMKSLVLKAIADPAEAGEADKLSQLAQSLRADIEKKKGFKKDSDKEEAAFDRLVGLFLR
jgi:hypothetical protein